METRILRLKGRRFACGLAWRPQERRPLDRRLALAEASLQGASHCVQAQVQAGFASLPPQADEASLRAFLELRPETIREVILPEIDEAGSSR